MKVIVRRIAEALLDLILRKIEELIKADLNNDGKIG
tara:strand:+ start:1485 stop:1592 length:108 start_codon:yes stop_codon:yes gene_type:complete